MKKIKVLFVLLGLYELLTSLILFLLAMLGGGIQDFGIIIFTIMFITSIIFPVIFIYIGFRLEKLLINSIKFIKIFLLICLVLALFTVTAETIQSFILFRFATGLAELLIILYLYIYIVKIGKTVKTEQSSITFHNV